MIQPTQASPIRKCTMTESMGAVSLAPRSFVNIDTTNSGVPYCHGPASADGAQRAHPRGTDPGRVGAVPGPRSGGHVGRTDRGGRRGIAAHLLSPLQLEARFVVCRL